MWTLLNDLYGTARGYDRRRVRRAMAMNAARPAADVAAETERAFQAIVANAIARFPAYAAKVAAHRGGLPRPGEAVRPEELPVWTREDQRAFFAQQATPPLPGAFVNRTGGSTGVPLRYWVTRPSWEWRMAVSDRGYGWAGAQKGVRSLYVWGTAIHPPGRFAAWKGRLAAAAQRRVFFDSFRFGDDEKRRCCETINRVRPRALAGYAGNLIELARFVRAHAGVLRWRTPSLVTAAEGLPEASRALLKEHLADDVFVSYGSREFMLIGMECAEHNGYHLSSDNLLVEAVDEAGRPLPAGEAGRLVVTDLHNTANPFIRYEIGDAGRLAPPDEPCPCGLPFPRLLGVDGRVQEYIELPDGNRMTALFIPHLMKEFPWVEGYQVAQASPVAVTMRLLTREPLDPAATAQVARLLRGKVGADMAIGFARVDSLQRSPSGKVPIVVKETH